KRWSPNEDAILRHEVQSCEATTPVSWAQIAERLPGRSNKDCRKRWAKIDGRWHRGGWSESEDAKLRVAVACHGTRWAMVSDEVGTRNPDQCHKRWRNALSLDLDRSVWT
ncbi:putative Myb-like protein A, partial [Colletotrichum zoysiae]